jgi:FtsP/CotA-like multicopper oxidase with cupredoxin domain
VILVGDVRTRIPGGGSLPERTILVKDYQPWGPEHSGGSIFTLNGQAQARFTIARGTRQVWHIGNVGSDTPMGIKLLGSDGRTLPMIIIARDGNPVATPERADSIRMWPAERYDLVVQTNDPAGTRYAIINTDSSNAANGRGHTLGWLTVTAGTPASFHDVPRDPAVTRRVAQVMARPVAGRRTFVFEEDTAATGETNNFWINGRPYRPDTVDVQIPLGGVEEWTLINRPSGNPRNTDPHVFHIHQGDFIVTRINGRPVTPNSFQDRVDLAPGDTIVVRIPFTDPWQVGLYVFHCHLLFHEDHGMMRNMCVYDPRHPGNTCTVPTSAAAHGH